MTSLKHCSKLLRRNPNGHVGIKLEDGNAFSRMLVCLKAHIDAFILGCRPFLGLVGCHLSSMYLDTLLSAAALGSNNGLFPVAFAVIKGES